MIPTLAERNAFNEENGRNRSQAVAAAIRLATPDGPALTALDYGCGPGHIGLRLADHFAHVTLVDVDSEAVAQAADAAANMANITPLTLDLSVDAPPTDLCVDVVFSCLAWHHVTNLGALLAALAIVSPGGRLFVAEMYPDGGAYHAELPDFDGVDGFDPDALAALLAKHGYTDVATKDLWTGQKWVAGSLTTMKLFMLEARLPNMKR